jgi:hypothetical protein
MYGRAPRGAQQPVRASVMETQPALVISFGEILTRMRHPHWSLLLGLRGGRLAHPPPALGLLSLVIHVYVFLHMSLTFKQNISIVGRREFVFVSKH